MLKLSSPYSLNNLKRDLDNGWQLVKLNTLPATLYSYKRGATRDVNHLYFRLQGTGEPLLISVYAIGRPYQLGTKTLTANVYLHEWWQNVDATGLDWSWLVIGFGTVMFGVFVLAMLMGAMLEADSMPYQDTTSETEPTPPPAPLPPFVDVD